MVEKIKRHEIDSKLVNKSVNRQIADYKEMQSQKIKELTSPNYDETDNAESKKNREEKIKMVTDMYSEWIDREKNEYSLVRVIEDREKEGRKLKKNRFYLVYGTEIDFKGEWTGPFESFAKAKKWFVSDGR